MSVYIIAGVTGRVGSVVASELLAKGAKIRAITRDGRRAHAWSGRGADVAAGSLDDSAFLSRTLDGVSGFFTLLPEDLSASDFHGHRRRMAKVIAAAVKQSRVPHLVMHSAIGAVLADRNGPAKALHHLENSLRATGARLTANRACYLPEDVASAIPPARQSGVYPNFMPSADAAFPTIASVDVGRLAAQALMMPPPASEVVDLLGPAYSSRRLAEKLGVALGRKPQIVDIPPAGQVAALTGAGLPQVFAEAVAELLAAFAAGLIAPKGDRTPVGTTTVDAILPGLLSMDAQVAASGPPGERDGE